MSESEQFFSRFGALLLAVTASTAALSCAGPGGAGPAAPTSVRSFEASEERVNSAVTNAFGGGQYCDMLLGPAVGHDFLAHGWHPTNGFLLQPGTGSAYRGWFHIIVSSLATNQTQVTVRTVLAEAVNGKEPGVHGGWAFHFKRTPPIPQEEVKVLAAVAAALNTHER